VEYGFGLLRRMAAECARPLSFTLLQLDRAPRRWRTLLDLTEEAAAEGVDIKAQVCARAPGLLIGLQATINPFSGTPSYGGIADLPLDERVRRMRQPEVREAILGEYGTEGAGMMRVARQLDRVFQLGDPPDYEPSPEQSLAARAGRMGIAPAELLYDLVLEKDGRELLFLPAANYSEFNLDATREMVVSDRTLFGLSDGGAHVGVICDASFPTYNLAHWCRDRKRGEQLSLEFVVKGQSADTARHVGWRDRGVLAPGYKADINVIDFDALKLRPPRIVHDLPAGGRRLLQEAEGYRYTVCSGEVTFEDGQHTGALPGKLVRGARG
jgi:N-acyl-D-aspartate/D-glutamate deacylase